MVLIFSRVRWKAETQMPFKSEHGVHLSLVVPGHGRIPVEIKGGYPVVLGRAQSNETDGVILRKTFRVVNAASSLPRLASALPLGLLMGLLRLSKSKVHNKMDRLYKKGSFPVVTSVANHLLDARPMNRFETSYFLRLAGSCFLLDCRLVGSYKPFYFAPPCDRVKSGYRRVAFKKPRPPT